MRDINATGLWLNCQSVLSAAQDAQPDDLIILRGNLAQRYAYMMVCDEIKTDFSRALTPMAFALDRGMKPDQLAIYAFNGGVIRQLAFIRNIAIPNGFDTGNPLLDDSAR